MSTYQVDQIDILKVDIEGAVKELLEKPHNWLGKVRYLVIETHDRMKAGCSDALARALEPYKTQTAQIGENTVVQFL